MKRNVNIILIILIIVAMNSCEMLYKKQIVNNYYLTMLDQIYDASLDYKSNDASFTIIINPAVFAAGSNDNFIIAKQHPCKFGDTPDKKITNYYIIPLKNKISDNPVENKIGPLTKSGFEFQRKKLGISDDLDFTIIIKELE